MKFIYFGYDFMLHMAQQLITEGHELGGVYSFPCDGVFNHNTKTQALAQQHGVGFMADPVTSADIENDVKNDATAFIAAGYPYKIPPIDEGKAYGINIHPSYLPMARGIMPTPTILMHKPDAAGVTIHKLAEKFDCGDILMQKRIPLTPYETVDTYSARIAMEVPDMIISILRNIDTVWNAATPQDNTKASYAPMPNDAMRTLDWNNSIEVLDTQARAFGRYGVLGTINGQPTTITAHDIWKESHTHNPGTVILNLETMKIITAKDGFFIAKQFILT